MNKTEQSTDSLMIQLCAFEKTLLILNYENKHEAFLSSANQDEKKGSWKESTAGVKGISWFHIIIVVRLDILYGSGWLMGSLLKAAEIVVVIQLLVEQVHYANLYDQVKDRDS